MTDKVDKQQEFIELRAKGNSFDNIAKQLGVSKGTLVNWSRELDNEVKNYSALELDTLKDKYLLAKNHQIGMFGEQLAAIREELSQRDLSDVKTEKLIETEIKLLDAINRLGIATTLIGAGFPEDRICTTWEA